METNFKGNSNTDLDQASAPVAPKKVKGIFSNAIGGIIAKTGKDVGDQIRTDVANNSKTFIYNSIAQFTDLISVNVKGVTARILFGNNIPKNISVPRLGSADYRDYSSVSNPNIGQPNNGTLISGTLADNQSWVDNIAFLEYSKAENTRRWLVRQIEQYHVVTVQQLYRFIGQPTSNYLAANLGWKNLSDTNTVVKSDVRTGNYYLSLPTPETI